MSPTTKWLLLSFSILIASGVCAQSGNGEFASVKSVERDVEEVEAIFISAEKRFLSPLVVKKKRDRESYSQRLKKGRYFFDKRDYSVAGGIYYSIFANRSERDFVWEEALFMLAESLYQGRNYISASRYYEMLLAARPNTRFQVDSLKRLIASAYHLGEYSRAKNYYAEFIGIGYDISNDKELIYYLGKALFFDRQMDEAYDIFQTLGEKSRYYLQSLYFMSVIRIEGGDFDGAENLLKKIISTPEKPDYFQFSKIRDLSRLALARIYFERNDFIQATDYYLRLSRKSDYFLEGYFELCWTYIKRGEDGKALDTLRLLKLIAPDSTFAPRVDLLEGNLLIKMKRYGEAMVAFDGTVKKYGEVMEQISNLSDRRKSGSFLKTMVDDKSFSLFHPS